MGSTLSYEGDGRDTDINELIELLYEQLGINEDIAKEETMGTYAVRLDWLKEQSRSKALADSDAWVPNKLFVPIYCTLSAVVYFQTNRE